MPTHSALSAVTLILAAALLAGCTAGEQPDRSPVTVASQARLLTNVAAFAAPPQGTAALVSSYDRTGGNDDGGLWVMSGGPDANGEVEVATLRGPGCVTRIWQTSVPVEEWRFYFDGEASPRLQLTTKQLFGEQFPFVPPLADLISAGRFSQVPLPYEDSLRIAVYAPDRPSSKLDYVHVGYNTYGRRGQRVASYPRTLDTRTTNTIQAVRNVWNSLDTSLRRIVDETEASWSGTIAPRTAQTWFEQDTAGALAAFWLRISPPDGTRILDRNRLLRQIVLTFRWNDAKEPSVSVPLGDFFCNAFHTRDYSALPMGVVDDVFVCRLPMPFERSARAILRNDSALPLEVSVGFQATPLPTAAPCRYYHARWNQAVSTGQPFGVLSVSGTGHFAGCYVSCIGMDGTWNILEGDEAIWVDGEMVWHGTGLEDYFSGAWYYAGVFDEPLHGLLEKAPIRTDQYRFHLTDRIGFDESFRIQFEFGHGNAARGYMSSVAHWYQDAPGPSGSVIPPVAQRYPPPDPLEKVAIMSHVFEMERAGDYPEAADRCIEYTQKFPQETATTAILKARAAAYAWIDGNEVDAAQAWRQMAAEQPDTAGGKQARAWLWATGGPRNALIGAHANGRYRLYIDGESIAQGDNPARFHVAGRELSPGEHLLTAEVVPTRFNAWFSACVRWGTNDVFTDNSWEYSREKPTDWPLDTSDTAVEWTAYRGTPGMLPRIGEWQLAPNAFVCMQHRRQLIRAWSGWHKRVSDNTAYYRKRFTVPATP